MSERLPHSTRYTLQAECRADAHLRKSGARPDPRRCPAIKSFCRICEIHVVHDGSRKSATVDTAFDKVTLFVAYSSKPPSSKHKRAIPRPSAPMSPSLCPMHNSLGTRTLPEIGIMDGKQPVLKISARSADNIYASVTNDPGRMNRALLENWGERLLHMSLAEKPAIAAVLRTSTFSSRPGLL